MTSTRPGNGANGAMRMKFAHKAILIVLVPLIFQSAFYVVLKRQLAESEVQATQLDLARRLVSQSSIYLLNMGNLLESLVKCCLSSQPDNLKRLKELEALSFEHTDRLCKLLLESRHELEVKEFRRLNALVIKEIDEDLQHFMSLGPLKALDVDRDLEFGMRHIDAVRRCCERIAHREATAVLSASEQERKTSEHTERALDLAAGTGLALAVLLVVFLMRGTIAELSVLKDNCRRLAANQPLSKRLDSRNEVAEVDRVFHEMAQALREAADREKAMLTALKLSEERLRSVIETLPVAIIVTNASGSIESLNRSAEILFACTEQEALNRNIAELLAAPESSFVDLDQFAAATLIRPAAMEALSEAGQAVKVEVSLTSFEHSSGKRYVATVVDVTQRHRMERLKREFVSMVSHDISTPLKAIGRSLAAISSGAHGAVGVEIVSKFTVAQSNTLRLLQMVESLLDLERLESGLLEVKLQNFSSDRLVEVVLPLVAEVAAEKGVAVVAAAEAFEVSGDFDALAQVLTNFLSNAIRYSPANSKVRVCAKSIDDGRVEISVIDQGAGVPLRKQTEIFERFKQANRQRDKDKGFGLGLAICKSIVEQHGQSIGVESDGMSGSRFWFTIAAAQTILSDETST